MKAFLRTMVLGYFYCGIALGFIVWASYMWGFNAAVSAEVPMAERLKATLNIQPMVALETGTRVIAWGHRSRSGPRRPTALRSASGSRRVSTPSGCLRG